MAAAPLPTGTWSPEVHARLVALLDAPAAAPRHAVLDWDDTVLEGDCSLAMMRAMDAERGTTWHDTYFELLAAHGRPIAYPRITQWWAGSRPEEAAAALARAGRDALARGVVRFRPELVDLVEALHARGWQVWVVTASPALLVAPLAAELGIPEARVLGMRLHVGADGRFTEQVVEPATWGDGKRLAVLDALGGPPDLAAGDSSSDAPMMRIAREALLVDGHDAALRAEALAAGWMVQAGWKHTPAEPGLGSRA